MSSILVIDDEAELRTVLRDVLEDAGYAVVEARNGCEGLQRCQAWAIDLVMTDILMPEHDGCETLRALQAMTPPVTIIVMSGGGMVGPVEILKQMEYLGAHHTLQKPMRRAVLLAAVRQVLGEAAGQVRS